RSAIAAARPGLWPFHRLADKLRHPVNQLGEQLGAQDRPRRRRWSARAFRAIVFRRSEAWPLPSAETASGLLISRAPPDAGFGGGLVLVAVDFDVWILAAHVGALPLDQLVGHRLVEFIELRAEGLAFLQQALDAFDLDLKHTGACSGRAGR